MKIIEAISDMNIGGAGILLLSRLEVSKKEADETIVLIPNGSLLKRRLDDLGIASIEIEGCYDSSFDMRAIPKFIKVIRMTAPDIINCHGCLSCRMAAFICKVPVRIYTRHCTYPIKWWQKIGVLRSLCGALQCTLSTNFIAVAYAAREDLISTGVPIDRINVIVNGAKGVDRYAPSERERIRKALGIPLDARVIGIFARLEKCKGHSDLLAAAEILLKKNKSYRFLIVGGGSLESDLKNEAKARGIEKYVIFTGFVKKVTPYFNVTDINVNCSIGTETSSLALSEGMSLGIPAVASNYGGNRYMIRDGVNGFTYEAGNYVALSKRIFLLSYGKTLYRNMSQNAYERYRSELNAETMSKNTYALYSDLYRPFITGTQGIGKKGRSSL